MTSLAIISDVHGNLEALEAVLDELAQLNCERIYSLGDTIGYGPDPVACARLVRERCDVILMGNHELALFDSSTAFYFNAIAKQAIDWTRNEMRQAGELAAIQMLPPFHQEEDLLFVHGSAREPIHEYVKETDDSGCSTFDEVVESLEHDFADFSLCFVGHNHHPFLGTAEGFLHPHDGQREFSVDGEKLYVSVGSVGQPRDGDWRSCFCTFDGHKVGYHRVSYDKDKTAAKILDRGLPTRLAQRILRGR